jgi:hypothetical protein
MACLCCLLTTGAWSEELKEVELVKLLPTPGGVSSQLVDLVLFKNQLLLKGRVVSQTGQELVLRQSLIYCCTMIPVYCRVLTDVTDLEEGDSVAATGRFIVDAGMKKDELDMKILEGVSFQAESVCPAYRLKAYPMLSEVLTRAGYDSVVQAFHDTGLMDALESEEEITLFLPRGQYLETLCDKADGKVLRHYFLHHTVRGRHTQKALLKLDSVPTLAGGSRTLHQARKGRVGLESAPLLMGDIAIANGLIHTVRAAALPDREILSPPIHRIQKISVSQN